MERKIINNESNAASEQNVANNENATFLKPYKYDLLCVVNGKKVRLSYDDGCYRKIFGIFPFKDSNLYLNAIETEITIRLGVNEEKVPSVDFWKSIFEIKDELNTALADLHLAPINGRYYATAQIHPYSNWIVTFKDNCDRLLSDFYGSGATAKIRYFGEFE